MHLARSAPRGQAERHHIVERHEAAAPGAGDRAEIDAETARQCPRRRYRAHARARHGIGSLEHGIGFLAAARHLSDHGAAVRRGLR